MSNQGSIKIMPSKKIITLLAVAAGLAVPATTSAATGSIAVQSVDGSQVTANVSATATDADSYYGHSYWFIYVTQVDGTQACSSSGLVMLSTTLVDGDVPRDPDGHFTAPGTYTTAVKFTASHEPQTRICVYASTLASSTQQLVAETMANTTAAPGQYRIGAICNDGWRSSATGSGACSSHGGVSYWLYSSSTPATPTPTPRPPVVAPVPTPAPTPPPAVPAAPVSHSVICNNRPVSKPRSCSVRAGQIKLSKLRWQSWGTTAKATGKGRFVGGTVRTARITLSQPKDGVYTKMTIKMAHRTTRVAWD